MARIPAPKIYSGVVRSPLSFGLQKQLTSNPLQLAAQEMKPQFAAPKVPKLKSSVPKRGKGPSPFYGE